QPTASFAGPARAAAASAPAPLHAPGAGPARRRARLRTRAPTQGADEPGPGPASGARRYLLVLRRHAVRVRLRDRRRLPGDRARRLAHPAHGADQRLGPPPDLACPAPDGERTGAPPPGRLMHARAAERQAMIRGALAASTTPAHFTNGQPPSLIGRNAS